MTHMNGGDPSLDRIESLGVFADWRLPTDEQLRFVGDTMREAHSGWSRIILGIWPKNTVPGWKPRYRPETVRERLRACKGAGLDPVVMAWARRDERAITEMCEWLKEATYHGTPLLLDAEGKWHKGTGIGEGAAADMVSELLTDEVWGVTGLGWMHSSVNQLWAHAQFIVPQCYSFWRPSSRTHWSHTRSTFPGHQQREGYNSWFGWEKNDCIMGLGCYWGARPARGLTPALTATQTMRIATIETAALGVKSIWWWSLKWLMKKGKRGEEVRRFFGVRP